MKKKIIFWGLAVFLLITGVIFTGISVGVSVISILLSLFICPATDSLLKKIDFYEKFKVIIVIISILAWFIMVGNIPESELNNAINQLDNTIVNSSLVENQVKENKVIDTTNKISLSEIPEYSDSPYVEINENVPFFDDSEMTTEAFEKYSELDSLGRVGIATACIEAGMDDKPRENISKVTPTGWKDSKYDGIDGGNLYNRCHIIANQLTGENDNEKNLITGTRYFNTQGMERFEYQVAEYIKKTNNHVLYRVTPMFKDDNLLANGVLIEAKSVEDKGEGVQFNVFCYNVQPGIKIDYKTGDNSKIEEEKKEDANTATATVAPAATTNSTPNTPSSSSDSSNAASTQQAPSPAPVAPSAPAQTTPTEQTYILNTSRKKFHHPGCSSVSQMKDKNKREYTGTRESLINQGYTPCGRCNP